MIDHISSYTTHYSTTKEFYSAVFSALGYSIQSELVAEWNAEYPTQRMCAFGVEGKNTFWIIEVKQKFTSRHMAFSAKSRVDVENFYSHALDKGAVCNGKPGIRPIYHDHYYAAFVIDPDGNNIEAVCHG